MNARIGFGPRLLAFAVDSLIVGFTASLLMSVIMPDTFHLFMSGQYIEALAAASKGQESASHIENFQLVVRVSSFITSWSLLYMLIEGFLGASPGKMLLGLKIGTEKGNIADTRIYFNRYLAKNSPSLLMVIAKTTGISILGDLEYLSSMVIFFGYLLTFLPHRQGIHDMIAKTAVYRKKELEQVKKHEETI